MYASVELSKELYEISGWESAEWWQHMDGNEKWLPKYSLGYLLRKLPHHIRGGELVLDIGVDVDINVKNTDYYWLACYARFDDLNKGELKGYAATPEDAACKLAVELFRQGVLTPAQSTKKEEA